MPGKFVKSWAGLALARANDTAQARALADQLNSEFPSDTLVQNYWLPTIRAEIELSAGNATRALEFLRAAEPYELAAVADQYRGGGPMLPVLVRAEAYVVARDGLSAAREFQKVLQHRRLMFNNTEGAMARLGLARAYAVSGNKAMAHGAYQDFLKLWQDADPDVPILKQARIEYGRLN